jgi:hypothetical protein
VFDNYGYFHIQNPSTNATIAIPFANKNAADYTNYTDTFSFEGDSFSVKYGFAGGNTFRFEITQTSGNFKTLNFRSGGNMGADSNSSWSGYLRTGKVGEISGNNNVIWFLQHNDLTNSDPTFYQYMVSKVPTTSTSNTHTFNSSTDNGEVSFPFQEGIIVYMTKGAINANVLGDLEEYNDYTISYRSKWTPLDIGSYTITKDMVLVANASTVGGLSIPANTSVFTDWGNDVFDNAGYFHIRDGSSTYALPFSTKNGPTGTYYEETFTAFGVAWKLKHGFSSKSIFRMELTQTSGDLKQFSFASAGGMGSDGNVNWGSGALSFNHTGDLDKTVNKMYYIAETDNSLADPPFTQYYVTGNPIPSTSTMNPMSATFSGDTFSAVCAFTKSIIVYWTKAGYSGSSILTDIEQFNANLVSPYTTIGTIKLQVKPDASASFPLVTPADSPLRAYNKNGVVGGIQLVDVTDMYASPVRVMVKGGAIKSLKYDCAFYGGFAGTAYTSTSGVTLNSSTVNGYDVTSSNVDPMLMWNNIGSFDPNKYRYVEVRMKIVSTTATTDFQQILYTNSTYTTWNASAVANAVITNLNDKTNFVTYTFDMWTSANWKTGGNITGLRWDFSNTSSFRAILYSLRLRA